jgi:hypothetical protein
MARRELRNLRNSSDGDNERVAPFRNHFGTPCQHAKFEFAYCQRCEEPRRHNFNTVGMSWVSHIPTKKKGNGKIEKQVSEAGPGISTRTQKREYVRNQKGLVPGVKEGHLQRAPLAKGSDPLTEIRGRP